MTDDDLAARVRSLHEHLRATRELPVERSAARWIGEAEAVVADVDGEDVPAEVVRERVGHVRSLLANVEETDHDEADDHVDRARGLAAEIGEGTDEE